MVAWCPSKNDDVPASVPSRADFLEVENGAAGGSPPISVEYSGSFHLFFTSESAVAIGTTRLYAPIASEDASPPRS
jgi:hypothetical protein